MIAKNVRADRLQSRGPWTACRSQPIAPTARLYSRPCATSSSRGSPARWPSMPRGIVPMRRTASRTCGPIRSGEPAPSSLVGSAALSNGAAIISRTGCLSATFAQPSAPAPSLARSAGRGTLAAQWSRRTAGRREATAHARRTATRAHRATNRTLRRRLSVASGATPTRLARTARAASHALRGKRRTAAALSAWTSRPSGIRT